MIVDEVGFAISTHRSREVIKYVHADGSRWDVSGGEAAKYVARRPCAPLLTLPNCLGEGRVVRGIAVQRQIRDGGEKCEKHLCL